MKEEEETGFRRADYFRPVFWQFRYSGQTLYGPMDDPSSNVMFALSREREREREGMARVKA